MLTATQGTEARMYRSYNQRQPFLLPPSLYDFVDESHPAHLINDLVDQLDPSARSGQARVPWKPATATWASPPTTRA